MHGLIFETSIWLLAGSTRYLDEIDWNRREPGRRNLRPRPPSTQHNSEERERAVGDRNPPPSPSDFYCFQLRELKSDDESKFPVPSGSLTRAHDGCFPLQVVQCSHRREEPIFSQTVCTSISPGRDPENRARCRRGHRPKESWLSRPPTSSGGCSNRWARSSGRPDNRPSALKPASTRGSFRGATRGPYIAVCSCLIFGSTRGTHLSRRCGSVL